MVLLVFLKLNVWDARTYRQIIETLQCIDIQIVRNIEWLIPWHFLSTYNYLWQTYLTRLRQTSSCCLWIFHFFRVRQWFDNFDIVALDTFFDIFLILIVFILIWFYIGCALLYNILHFILLFAFRWFPAFSDDKNSNYSQKNCPSHNGSNYQANRTIATARCAATGD